MSRILARLRKPTQLFRLRQYSDYVGPFLVQTDKGAIYQPVVKITMDPIRTKMQQRNMEKFEMNTHFDHDYFWETINYSLSDMFMCILKQEYTFLLDNMDRRNMLRFAFWLTSLTANQKIFMAIEKALERDFSNRMTDQDFHYYKVGDDLPSCRAILEGIIYNDAFKSFIFSDSIEIHSELIDDYPVWFVSVYFVNVDRIGGIPEYTTDEELSQWCERASEIANAYCGKLTLSYDVNMSDDVPFNPEKLKLWRLAFSNPGRVGNNSVLPQLSVVSVVPQVPANIEVE